MFFLSLLQANLTNADLEGALTTGNTSFRGSIITGAGNFVFFPSSFFMKKYNFAIFILGT